MCKYGEVHTYFKVICTVLKYAYKYIVVSVFM